MAGPERQLSCGLICGCVDSVKDASCVAAEMEFDFISCCVGHPRCCLDVKNMPAVLPPMSRADLELKSGEWTRHIVGEMSLWIDVDSDDQNLRELSEQALYEELRYANYLSLTVMLIPLRSVSSVNLARLINSFLHRSPFTSVWLNVPASLPSQSPENGNGDVLAPEDPWQWWDTFRGLCDNHKKLGLALDIPADLPDHRAALRWHGEPVKCITIDTSVFLTNRSGSPVLSRAHQRFIHGFYKLDCQAMISGSSKLDGKSVQDYKNYLDWLWHQQPAPDSYSAFCKGYEDHLQVPLQPLSDNLESQIYETFERDPIKYTEYEAAIEAALCDKKAENTEDFVTTIMVLGAGRGPLVTATLRAAARNLCRVKIYAVEKNPSAIITLKHLQKHSPEWEGKDVEVIHCDMRKWEPEQKADIIVSELLGSFGDNELSPECLDGAQRLLKGDAISIPSSYTSYVVPVQSQKLYSQIRDYVEKSGSREDAYDNGYVVRVHNRFELGKPKSLFTFKHPNFECTSNRRQKMLEFNVEEDCEVHGIAGFFDAVLYKDVVISTVPETHSPGMFSWFPMLFPLREPVRVHSGDNIQLHFWRLHDSTQVWYEWCLSKPIATAVQNSNGATYKMKLY